MCVNKPVTKEIPYGIAERRRVELLPQKCLLLVAYEGLFNQRRHKPTELIRCQATTERQPTISSLVSMHVTFIRALSHIQIEQMTEGRWGGVEGASGRRSVCLYHTCCGSRDVPAAMACDLCAGLGTD
jgi:hypothetical protein